MVCLTTQLARARWLGAEGCGGIGGATGGGVEFVDRRHDA